jgi:hypothetical protein
MSKDNEDVLVDFFIVARVDDHFGDLRLVHVKVTTESSPEDALKGSNAVPRDDTCNEANVHFREALLTLSVSICAARGVLFDVAKKGRFVIVEGLADIFGVGVGLVA